MPSNSKETNQYYGKYRECCVVAHLNKTDVEYNEGYDFSEEEKSLLFQQSKLIADYLGNHKAEYLGNHTKLECGDIKLDNGEIIEIKTVSSGTGTYFNTSIYYFEKYGFNFKDYMNKYGLYETLENNFGDKFAISRKNKSPVNKEISSKIRHNYKELYKSFVVPVDLNVRKYFISDLVKYFSNNSDKVYEFITDMLNKTTSTCTKMAPDRLIVLNYAKNTIREINLKTFYDNINTNIKKTDAGLIIGNIRIAISWQNGVGLNNPTIRVFLEE